ncbi:Transcriptional regulator, LysR family [Methylophaga thiooxydans]|uniref:Transcriptional regulator, LysR family n=1 Tax=Methylophaga thiooxydans TaxID=392484 RepID=A0A0A0BFS6_9GAMM|nr:LysR family transcriptional regulator [Methylophaga thiooxydans]KGM06761.1 Transcriptional regulator, LysR family [Methylophaga thiooxydans]
MSVQAKTEDLETFIAVVDSGGFSSAALLLDQQVAKVSRAVSRLEAALNCTLLNRTTRRIELTEEGHLFIAYAREGLTALEKGEDMLRLMHGKPSGRLRVDAASPFVLHQLTPLISEFTTLYPDIHLDITSHDSIIDLLEHKTDVAIRLGDPKDSNINSRLLGLSKLHLVASPDYLAKQGEPHTESDLMSHRLIAFTDAPSLNDWPLINKVMLTFAIGASSGETVRQLCLAGQGVALLSNFMIRQDLNQGKLVEVLPGSIASPNRRESVQAVFYKNSAVSSRITALLDFIKPRLTL